MSRFEDLRFGPGMAAIALAAAVLLALQGLHGLDHLTLQDRPLEPQIAALGVLESAAVFLTLLLGCVAAPRPRSRRSAPAGSPRSHSPLPTYRIVGGSSPTHTQSSRLGRCRGP